MERRLAAILSADVVGYARLVRADEEGTIAALRALRADLIDPELSEHHGRIVKLMGDGMLVEFPSVVDAVRAAVAIQSALAARNEDLGADRGIEVRVGINLGDVIVDGDDIQGDGVNVAARLEGIAPPGGICVSGMVHEGVRDRIDTPFEDLGERELKNIERPVRVWQWTPKAAAPPAREPSPSTDRPSIAVLPFDNMSRDPEHEFFADGISEDIITALSKISRMRVIARNSTFAYKGRARDLRDVARDLGVRYVLEGSVRSGGNRLRITAQLIDADDGSHVWAERFDSTIDDIFDIQDEITKEIVTALRVKLTDGEDARMMARGTNDVEAWQLCVRAVDLILKFNTTDYLEARALAEQAVARDPNYAYALATVGLTYWWDGRLGFTSDSEAKFARAGAYAEQAMAIDDTVSWAIALSVHVAISQGREHEAHGIARRGIEVSPGSADLRAILALSLAQVGENLESVGHCRAAMSLNPFYPNWYRNVLIRNLVILGEFDEALIYLDEVGRREPSHLGTWVYKAYVFTMIGRREDAEKAIGEVKTRAPNLRLDHVPGLLIIKNKGATERIVEGLRAAGFPE